MNWRPDIILSNIRVLTVVRPRLRQVKETNVECSQCSVKRYNLDGEVWLPFGLLWWPSYYTNRKHVIPCVFPLKLGGDFREDHLLALGENGVLANT